MQKWGGSGRREKNYLLGASKEPQATSLRGNPKEAAEGKKKNTAGLIKNEKDCRERGEPSI